MPLQGSLGKIIQSPDLPTWSPKIQHKIMGPKGPLFGKSEVAGVEKKLALDELGTESDEYKEENGLDDDGNNETRK
ncbi:hypothetical protein RUM43_003905 [Polyplax serrata]|uniref:Uncharacterized protein n=1 Tax=Polyplax serrata TaxID=468196 RepID=A0AAN8S650_POLSC